MKYRKISTELILVLAAAGLCISLVLASGEGTPAFNFVCLDGACRATVRGPYANVGPFPVAVLGVVMYFLLALAAAVRARLAGRLEMVLVGAASFDPETVEQEEEARAYATVQFTAASLLIWFVAFVGTFAAWRLQYLSLFVSESFCLPCLISALIITGLCVLSCRELWLDSAATSPKLSKLWLAPAAALLVMGVAAWPSVNHQLAKIHNRQSRSARMHRNARGRHRRQVHPTNEPVSPR